MIFERRGLLHGGFRTQSNDGRLFAGEQLAQRMDEAQTVAFQKGLPDINSWIEREVYAKQQGGMSHSAALMAVAKENPGLFLTKARLELNRQYGSRSIYFDLVDGQLVNPRYQDESGAMVPIDSPLDVRALPPGSTIDQEIALRVAEKMQKLAASGAPIAWSEAMALVGSECPNLRRAYQGEGMRRC
jgi:hypothetical protein